MMKYSVISIPVWYDYKIDSVMETGCSSDISIPVWYDYKPYTHGLKRYYCSNFNSSMVRL